MASSGLRCNLQLPEGTEGNREKPGNNRCSGPESNSETSRSTKQVCQLFKRDVHEADFNLKKFTL